MAGQRRAFLAEPVKLVARMGATDFRKRHRRLTFAVASAPAPSAGPSQTFPATSALSVKEEGAPLQGESAPRGRPSQAALRRDLPPPSRASSIRRPPPPAVTSTATSVPATQNAPPPSSPQATVTVTKATLLRFRGSLCTKSRASISVGISADFL